MEKTNTINTILSFVRGVFSKPAEVTITTDAIAASKARVNKQVAEAQTAKVSGIFWAWLPQFAAKNGGGWVNAHVNGVKNSGSIVAAMGPVNSSEHLDIFHLGPVERLSDWAEEWDGDPLAVRFNTFLKVRSESDKKKVQAALQKSLDIRQALAKSGPKIPTDNYNPNYTYVGVLFQGTLEPKVLENKVILELVADKLLDTPFVGHPRLRTQDELIQVIKAAEEAGKLNALFAGAKVSKSEKEVVVPPVTTSFN